MSLKQFRIAVFASGSGTNAEAIITYFKGHPSIKIVLLLSNNENAYALERAKKHGIKNYFFSRQEFTEGTIVSRYLRDENVTHIVLAGFLWLIPDYLIKQFQDRIVNIHPALLPKYGGKGMYGSKVHEAVRASGDSVTGITIHLVNDKYDDGKVLFQKMCPVRAGDTPEEIAKCVQTLEHEQYPAAIERWLMSN